MRLRTTLRPLVICVVLFASLGLAACSSDGNNDSTGQSGGGGGSSTKKDYCDAVKGGLELAKQAVSGSLPPEEQARFVDYLVQAQQSTPAEIRADSNAAWRGDPYAQENVDYYVKTECGVDLSTIAP
jgi:hypothetical protein